MPYYRCENRGIIPEDTVVEAQSEREAEEIAFYGFGFIDPICEEISEEEAEEIMRYEEDEFWGEFGPLY